MPGVIQFDSVNWTHNEYMFLISFGETTKFRYPVIIARMISMQVYWDTYLMVSACISVIGPMWTNVSENSIKIQPFITRKLD